MNNPVKRAFYFKEVEPFNRIRLEHLESLNLDLENKTVFETGCGGKGDNTNFFLNKNCKVTLNDARKENILYLMKNIDTILPYNTWDLNNDIPSDTKYDIVFSYGLLYHLEKPLNAIKNFSNICKGMLILSTGGLMNGKDEGIVFKYEPKEGKEQSYTGTGCQPGRKTILNVLKKHFEYVYIPKTQPNHKDYPKKYPTTLPNRFIMIGSRKELNNENLTTTLPNTYL